MSHDDETESNPRTTLLHVDRLNTGGIVVGVDGGPAAAAALRWAAQQSRVTGMTVQVIHAWQLKAPHIGEAGLQVRQAASADARARATQWVINALAGSDPSLRWTLALVEDAPGPALVTRSRTAPLLVMGTGEHNGLRRLGVGSVSRYVIARAVPPVVVVRAPPGTATNPPHPTNPSTTTGDGPRAAAGPSTLGPPRHSSPG